MLTLAEINRMTRDQFIGVLGWVFEDSPWVAERAWARRPFPTRESLHQGMLAELERAPLAEQLALLRAHPDLGTRARVSAASAGEQAGVGLDRLTQGEYDQLLAMNRSYREKFGFPFLYAVKGSSKSDIFAALSSRVNASKEEEFRQALQQVYRIAWFRIADTIQS
jgi:OHCU decarboxylase